MPNPITTHAQAVAALLRLVGLDEEICDADTLFCRTVEGENVTAGMIVDCLRPDLRQPAEYRVDPKPAAKKSTSGQRALKAAKRGGRKAAAK